MKRSYAWLIALGCSWIALLLWAVGSVANPEAEANDALAHIYLCWGNYTTEDSVANLPIMWRKQWYFRIVNVPDESHLPITNPNVTIETHLDLVGLYPQPIVSRAPLYQWVHQGTIAENNWFLSGGFENESQIAPRRFSASRVVSPERLRDVETNQTVMVAVRLEEALPPEVDQVAVAAGFYPIASEYPLGHNLVDYETLEWSSTENWEIYHYDEFVRWEISANEIRIGEIYEFNATFRVVKSEHLEGLPLSNPFVDVSWQAWDWETHGRCKSIIVEVPEGVRAIFQADEELRWTSLAKSSYHHFTLVSYATSIVGEEPPFHTLSELIFTLHSCADLHVYDGMGRHVGLDYETNETEALIPDASFEVAEGDQIVTIPDPLPGNYSVVLIGTSTDPYELAIEGATETETFYTESILGMIGPRGRREIGVSIPEKVGTIVVDELPTFYTVVAALIFLALATSCTRGEQRTARRNGWLLAH